MYIWIHIYVYEVVCLTCFCRSRDVRLGSRLVWGGCANRTYRGLRERINARGSIPIGSDLSFNFQTTCTLYVCMYVCMSVTCGKGWPTSREGPQNLCRLVWHIHTNINRKYNKSQTMYIHTYIHTVLSNTIREYRLTNNIATARVCRSSAVHERPTLRIKYIHTYSKYKDLLHA